MLQVGWKRHGNMSRTSFRVRAQIQRHGGSQGDYCGSGASGARIFVLQRGCRIRRLSGMPTTRASGNQTGIPEGYAAIPIQALDLGAALRLCVLVRQTPEPAAGHLVLLRDLPDAMVYLGCLSDAGGHPRGWVEIWVQNADGLEAGLPAYGTSLFRYLYRPAAKDGIFVPVTTGAPTNPATRPLAEALKDSAAHIPLNPQGGLLMAQSFSPLGYEDYVDLLGGKAWKGIEHGKRLINFNGVYRRLDDWSQMQQSGSHLFLGGQGRAGRFVEAFHLKLQLLVEA